MRALGALVAVLAVVVATGCGGDSSEGSTAAGGLDVIGVSQCLGNSDFLLQPGQGAIEGKTPSGNSFTISFYADEAAAKEAFESTDAATSALVANAVVEATEGSEKLTEDELATVSACMDENRS